jgi:hypothetical protein
LGDLRETIDDLRDLGTEFPFDVLDRDVGVFDDVVQQSAGNGGRVELQVGENARHLDTVRHVRLARMPYLTGMRCIREPVGLDEQLMVEPVVGAIGTRSESGNGFVQRDRCHNRPASAKLMYRPRPTMMWSCTGISSKRPAATNCSVTARSSADGVGSPLG